MNDLTHSPADILGQLLIDISVGSDVLDGEAWPVFVSSEPTLPDNMLTTYDTQGVDQGRSMLDGELYTYHGVQTRIQATDPKTGWTKVNLVRRELSRVSKKVVHLESSSYLVWSLTQIGPSLALGKMTGESKRNLFTVNALLVVKQLS